MKAFTRAISTIAITLLILFCIPASAQQTGSKTIGVYAPTTTAMLVVAGSPEIASVSIVNTGSVIAYCGGSAVTYLTGTPVYPKTFIEFDKVTDDTYCITQASTANLRVSLIKGGGTIRNGKLETAGASNSAAANVVPMSDGTNLVVGNVIVKNLSTAITANSTTCSDASGSLAITINATGLGTVFRCDGTNYQLLAKYSDFSHGASLGTVATTSTTDDYIVTGYAGTLLSLDCSSIVALTADDTNYVTVTLTNLGQAGSGTNPMLAATAPNTTQATGGTGFAINTKRAFTINGTGSNLIVAAGDRLLLRFTATGTLANTLTGTKCAARFNRLS